MADTVLVKPRPGLILAGVPAAGGELPRALAEEWLADRLVVLVTPRAATSESPPSSAEAAAGPTRPAAVKQRRTK